MEKGESDGENKEQEELNSSMKKAKTDGEKKRRLN